MNMSRLFRFIVFAILAFSLEAITSQLTTFQLKGSVALEGIRTLKTTTFLSQPGIIVISQVVSTAPHKESLSFWIPKDQGSSFSYVLFDKIEPIVVNGKISDFLSFLIKGSYYYVLATAPAPADNTPVTISLEDSAGIPTKDANKFAKLYILKLVQNPDLTTYHFVIVKWEFGNEFEFCSCMLNSLEADPSSENPSTLSAALEPEFLAVRRQDFANGAKYSGVVSLVFDPSALERLGKKPGEAQPKQTIPLNKPGLVNSVQTTSGLFYFVADKDNCCGQDGVSIFVLGSGNIYFPAGCLPVKNLVSMTTTVINDYAWLAIASASDSSSTTGHGHKYGYGHKPKDDTKSYGSHGAKGYIHIYYFDKAKNTFEKLCELEVSGSPLQVRFDTLGTSKVIYVLTDQSTNNVLVFSVISDYSSCPKHLLTFTAISNPTQLRPNSFTLPNGASITQILTSNAQGLNIYEPVFHG